MERGVNSGMPLYGLTKGRQPNAERIRMTEKSTSQAEDGNPGWQALRKRQEGKNRTSKLEAQTPKVKPKRISPYLKGRTTERKRGKGKTSNLKPQIKGGGKPQRSNNREEKGGKGKPQTSNLKSKGEGNLKGRTTERKKGGRENLKPQISNQRERETSKVE